MAVKRLCMVFVDMEKAFDQVPSEVIWWALRRKGVMEREIMVIMKMYKNIKTSVQMDEERSDEFVVKVGVHQGSVLSPLLFAVVMDEITRDMRGGVKEILYADELVLLGDDRTEVENMYSEWKRAMKEKGMKVNVCKTKAFCTVALEVFSHLPNFHALYEEKGLEGISMKCTKCAKWVHKRCFGLQDSVKMAVSFVCKRYGDKL